MNNKPQIAFTFPFRWLKAPDKKFLKKNLNRMLGKNLPFTPNDQRLLNRPVSYFIRLKQHAYQPKGYVMSAHEMEELLDDSFVGARCVGFDKLFIQSDNTGSLPVMELEIFY